MFLDRPESYKIRMKIQTNIYEESQRDLSLQNILQCRHLMPHWTIRVVDIAIARIVF